MRRARGWGRARPCSPFPRRLLIRSLPELFPPRRPSAKEPRAFRPSCEALEDRLAPSCAVSLNSMTGELLVSGDNANDAVAVSRVNSLGTDYVRVLADGASYQFREADVRSIKV